MNLSTSAQAPKAAAAAARPRRLGLSAAAATGPSPAASATPRRAVDVAVIGSTLQAIAAAYLLAKRGKRTVLIEHAAAPLVPAGGRVLPQHDVVLHLPAATPHLVNAATEALALWRGVEAAADARGMLQLCGSVDIAPARGSSAASDALGAMQDASRAAGLRFGMLSSQEVSASFPLLRPPQGSAALYTPIGGVVQGRQAAAVLRAAAQRAGADVAATAAAQRCLRGWRDAGGHFALRCGPAAAAAAGAGAAERHAAGAAGEARAAQGGPAAFADGEVIWEAEQLLLLPDAASQQPSFAALGLAVPGASLLQVPTGRWRAEQGCTALPVWQLLGMGGTRQVDDPAAIDSCWGLPVVDWSLGSMLVAQSLADCQPLLAASGAGAALSAEQQQQRPARGDLVATAMTAMAAAAIPPADGALDAVTAAALGLAEGLEERPGSEEAVEKELARLAEQAQQREAAERRLATAGGLARRLIRGVGGPLLGADEPSASQQEQQQPQAGRLKVTATPDGEPGLGSHPGFEQGRVVAAFPAAVAAPGCLPGEQLAPLLARAAVGELLGQAPDALNAAAVALGREALGAEAVPLPADSWEGLRG